MEAKKIPYENIFGIWLHQLKGCPIQYKYQLAEDGKYYCFADWFNAVGVGGTLQEAVNDMLDALEDWAEIYISDLDDWFAHNPDDFPFVLKFRISTRKDLESCLDGRNTDDI